MAPVRRLIELRRNSAALRHGPYRQLFVSSEQLAFLTQTPQEAAVVAVNAASEATMALQLLGVGCSSLADLLNPPSSICAEDGRALTSVPGRWARVLQIERDR